MFDGKSDVQQSIVGLLYSDPSLSIEQLEEALSRADFSGINPLKMLIDEGLISERSVADLMSDTYGIERLVLAEHPPNPSLLGVMPIDYLEEHHIVPYGENGNDLGIALAEPMALSQIGNIRVMTGRQIDTRIVTYSEIQEVIADIRRGGNISGGNAGAQTSSGNRIDNSGDIQSKVARPQNARGSRSGEEIKSDVVDFVNKIIADAIEMNVSDIHVEPYKDRATLRYRIDGVLRYIDNGDFLKAKYPAVSTRLKIMASLDIAERRLPQDGAIYFAGNGREFDIRVSVLPVQNGERIVMRLLDRNAVKLSLDSLNLDQAAHESLMKAIRAPQGLVLVTGPTGSGKSTTLYSCVNEINTEGINILTVEDPVEYNIEGIGQVQVNETIGRSFATALRSFLRQDPEIILVGEIRDQETAEISVKASLTGHLVLSTLHTNSALESVSRLIDMGIPPYLLTNALTLVVAQRLGRKLCDQCIENDKIVTPELLLGLGATQEMAAGATPRKGAGCKACNRTGYKGRQGLYEVLNITPALREALLRSAGPVEIQQIVKDEGFKSLQEIGLSMLCDGSLAFNEYQRIIAY